MFIAVVFMHCAFPEVTLVKQGNRYCDLSFYRSPFFVSSDMMVISLPTMSY